MKIYHLRDRKTKRLCYKNMTIELARFFLEMEPELELIESERKL